MAIDDFFHFSKTEYARRISSYDLDHLRKQEIVKTRQITAAFCSVQTGAYAAVATHGGTLVLSAIGLRRMHVAETKLKLIRAELKKRDIPLHKLQKRDVLIPLGACVAGLGVGAVVDEAASHVTNTIAVKAGLFPNFSAVHALTMNPGDSISAAAHGAVQQLHEVGHAILSLDNGVSAAQDLARDTLWVPAASAEEAIGFHAGMVAMQAVERGIAGVASNSMATQGMKAMTGDAEKMSGLQEY